MNFQGAVLVVQLLCTLILEHMLSFVKFLHILLMFGLVGNYMSLREIWLGIEIANLLLVNTSHLTTKHMKIGQISLMTRAAVG